MFIEEKMEEKVTIMPGFEEQLVCVSQTLETLFRTALTLQKCDHWSCNQGVGLLDTWEEPSHTRLTICERIHLPRFPSSLWKRTYFEKKILAVAGFCDFCFLSPLLPLSWFTYSFLSFSPSLPRGFLFCFFFLPLLCFLSLPLSSPLYHLLSLLSFWFLWWSLYNCRYDLRSLASWKTCEGTLHLLFKGAF